MKEIKWRSLPSRPASVSYEKKKALRVSPYKCITVILDSFESENENSDSL